METVFDLVDPTELQGFVRTIGFPEFGLSAWLPDVSHDDLDYAWRTGQVTDMDVALFRAWDTPSTRDKRPGVVTVSGELAPISKMMEIGEEEGIRIRRLLRNAAPGDQKLLNAIFDDVRRLARSVYGRVEIAKSDAIFTGVVTIVENGLAQSIDQGFDASQIVDIGNDADFGAKYFTDATADILGVLEHLCDDWQDRNNGARPGAILASRSFRRTLRTNGIIIDQATAGVGGVGEVPESRAQSVLDDFGIPPIYVNETSLPYGGANRRLVPDNKIAILPQPSAPNAASTPSTQTLDPTDVPVSLGRCFWGPTAEADELVEAQQIAADLAPGITAVNLKQAHPVAKFTNVSGVVMPVIGNSGEVTVAQWKA